MVSKLIKKARYLRCLLRFQFPEQLALLGHTGMWTGGGVCLCAGRGRSGGGRRHAWFVVHTCLLLKLGLQREREKKNEIQNNWDHKQSLFRFIAADAPSKKAASELPCQLDL